MAANVAVTNTTGLYNISSSASVPNSAAQLLALLNSNGNVNFSLTGSGNQVQANAIVSGGSGGTYGNTQVAEFLPTYTGTLDNSSTIVTLTSNAASQQTQIDTLTANAATQATSINLLNANLGAFETYANATFGTSSYGNANVAALLSSNTIATINTTGNITTVASVNTNQLHTTDGIYAQGNVTAPYFLGDGGSLTNIVTKLIAGANIAISPAGGTGQVTISQIGGVAPLTSTGYYGSFYDTTNQYANVATTSYTIGINNTVGTNGVSLVNGNAMSFSNSGIYNVNFSIQLVNTDNAQHEANVWLVQNGTPLSYTNSQVTIPARASVGLPGAILMSVPFTIPVTAGDTVQLAWQQSAGSSVVYIASFTSGTSPTRPATPGVILTATQVTSVTGNQYGNSNVATFLGSGFGSNTITTTGAITAGNVVSTAGYFWSNGAAYQSSPTGAAGGDLTGTYPNPTLTTSGVVAGTYGDASLVPQIVVDAKGRVTSVSNIAVSGGSYGNTQVAAYLPTYTGNIGRRGGTGNYIDLNTTSFNNGYSNAVNVVGANVEVHSNAVAVFGAAGNVVVSSGSWNRITGTTGTIIEAAPVYINGGNVTVSATGSSGGFLTATGNIAATYFIGDGSKLTNITSSYGNVQASALIASGTIPASFTTIGASSFIAATGPILANDTTDTTSAATGALQSAGGAYIAKTLLVAGNIKTSGNIVTTGGIVWANNTPYSGFTGDLAGSVLQDSTNNRFFGNAYPLSTPDSTKYANGYSNFITNKPVYTSGILQPVPVASGSQSLPAQATTMVTSANVALQSAYGSGSIRTTTGTANYIQVLPVTANSMSNNDRVRGTIGAVDINLNTLTWGTMSSTSAGGAVVAGVLGVTQALGTGSAAHLVGVNGVAGVNPGPGGYANVQYATGMFGQIAMASNVSTVQGNIVNARMFGGVISGFSSNLTVQNAIGLHTHSGWAGSGVVGSASNPILGRYAVLNEDANTVIQTNGNVTITGNTNLGAIKETVYALGNQTGTVTVAYTNGTVQTLTATGNLTINAANFTNLYVGGTVTLVITQDGTGGRTLTSDLKFAGGSKTLSTAAGAIDTITVFYDGTNYLASLVKGYA